MTPAPPPRADRPGPATPARGASGRRGPRSGPAAAPRAAPILLALAPLMSWPHAAHALELGWFVGGGLEYSDNMNRGPEGSENSDWVRDVRTGVVLTEETSRTEASLEGVLLYEDYADDTFGSGFVFEGSAGLDVALVPERLTWVTRNTYQQVPEDSRTVVTRGTEQDTNAFVTGPDLDLPLSAVDSFRLSARYGDFYFEETNEDHTRHVGAVGLAHRLSRISEVSLNARAEEIRFDRESTDETNPREDFVNNSAFVRYDRRLPDGGALSLDLGSFEVERDSLPDVDGTLARLTARRGFGANAEAGFQVGRGSTDLGAALTDARDDPLAADATNVDVTGDVGLQRTARVFYAHELGRLSLNVSGGAAEEDYEVEDELDRELAYASIGLDYRATRQRNLFVGASRTRTDYDEPREGFADEEDHYRYTAGFDQRLGRALTATVVATHNRRYTAGGGSEYEENVLGFTLVYGFGHPDVTGEGA